MTLPINHLIRTLDRCCGDYEILAHTDSTREPFEATVEHLQAGNVYRCSKRKDHNWTASDAHSEFLINRLNGLRFWLSVFLGSGLLTSVMPIPSALVGRSD